MLGLLVVESWLTAEQIEIKAFPEGSGPTQARITRILINYRDRGTLRSRPGDDKRIQWAFTEEGLRRWNAGLRGQALIVNAYAKNMTITRIKP